MSDPYEYTITVRRRELDGEEIFEAAVAELPDVRGYGETYAEAYDFAIETIADLSQRAVKEGLAFPAPRPPADEEYSGRVTLRLPKHVHRLAAQTAAAEGMSLNAYLNSVVAADVSRKDVTGRLQQLLVRIQDFCATPILVPAHTETVSIVHGDASIVQSESNIDWGDLRSKTGGATNSSIPLIPLNVETMERT